MATLSEIAVHPIKGLQPVEPDEITIAKGGGLESDRKYALFSREEEYINGRRNSEIQRIRSEFDLESDIVTLWTEADGRKRRFHMEKERAALEEWFSDFFSEPVTLQRAHTNFTDNAGALSRKMLTTPGPSVIAHETLREVASWFPGLIDGPEEMRLRTRPNLVVDGVDPFWEERLYADEDSVVRFDIGDVSVQGLRPLPRCSVPAQNPATGELIETFVSEFVEKRRETFPEWGDPDLLGSHDELDAGQYYLAVVTRLPTSEWGKTIAIGDEVSVEGTTSLITAL